MPAIIWEHLCVHRKYRLISKEVITSCMSLLAFMVIPTMMFVACIKFYSICIKCPWFADNPGFVMLLANEELENNNNKWSYFKVMLGTMSDFVWYRPSHDEDNL